METSDYLLLVDLLSLEVSFHNYGTLAHKDHLPFDIGFLQKVTPFNDSLVYRNHVPRDYYRGRIWLFHTIKSIDRRIV